MIVITTPTGQIGHQVLDNLLDSREKLRVIARNQSDLPANVRERLDVVEGSHGDTAVIDKAFAGADAVFWSTPPDAHAPSVEAAFVGFTRPAAEAFKRTASSASSACRRSAAARPGLTAPATSPALWRWTT